ncbi:glutathione S-transferase family protein [Aestuariibius sp. HNIBRBA575]|uniref:glutathione S-transferase family protein n=1 Tax=Aestuariibius sp. HNIBRBA575 TaxID=3233343 RepID=UPI0034A115FA
MIRLHHAHQTRSMRTLWLLHELGVEFDVVVHAFGKNLRSPEYRALHPVGRVPALEIDNAAMFETGAMAEYLTEKFPDAGLGRLPGDAERMEYLVWLHFAESISQHSAALTQQHVAIYHDEQRSPVVMNLEAKRLAKNYEALETQLEGRDYLLRSGFSAADIGIGQAIYMSRHFAHLDGFPNLTAWYARITDRPAFQKSLPPAGAQTLYDKEFYTPWEMPK